MFTYIVRDAVIFAVLGIGLGFLVDLIFIDPDPEESILETIFYILLQTIVCSIIIYYIAKFYEVIFKHDSGLYRGIDMFIVLFFLVQTQLFERVSLLFRKVTGKKLPNGL
jgi:hypothetical protein